VRTHEAALLVFGGMAGITWAVVALCVHSVSDGRFPGIVNFTLMLPLTTMFLVGPWLHPPIDALVLLFALGTAGGVLIFAACTVYLRWRDM